MLLTSAVSATIILSTTTPVTLSQSSGFFTIDVTSDVVAGENINFSALTITDPNGKTILFTPIPNTAFVANVSQTMTMNYVVQSGFNFGVKAYTTTFKADGASSTDVPSTLTFTQTNFCAWSGNNLTSTTADLEVKVKDVTVVSGFGEDNEWYPGDEVEVEVEVENTNNDYDIDNIVVEWGLFNKETGQWTIEVTDEDDFSLKEGDPKTLILTFKLEDMDEDLEDLDNGDFVFYVRATGEVDDDAFGYDVCTSDSEDVSIAIENDFVVLSDIQIPETALCGETIQVTADVVNIGTSDQEGVYVVLYNDDLGINQKVEIGDVNAFDTESFEVTLALPKDAVEKSYELKMSVYDENDDVYINDNDDKSQFSSELFRVEGACVFDPKLKTSADLTSGGTAGKEMVVKVTVTNTDSIKRTFTVGSSAYDTWAELVRFSPETLILEAEKSGEVELIFLVNSDVEGTKTFSLDLTNENGKVISQPIDGIVIEKAGFNLFGVTGAVIGNKNWYVWAIGALNIVLVLIIILVAVRLVKK